MNLLRTERDTLDRDIPGLDKYLSEIPLLELEKPGHGALHEGPVRQGRHQLRFGLPDGFHRVRVPHPPSIARSRCER